MSSTQPPEEASTSPAAPSATTTVGAHAGHARAKSLLEQGRVALAKAGYASARQHCKDGVAALGTDYAPDGTADDTSLKLALADDLEKQGKTGDAASTCLRMLAIRIQLYEKRHSDAPRDRRALALTLRVPSAPSAIDAPLSAELTLASTGSEPVVVNGRLAENTPHAPDPHREVTFEVEGPDARPLGFGPKIRIGAPQPSDARELAPGGSMKRTYDLAQLYDLKKPGSYRVRAFYTSAPLLDARERPVWTDQVESAWATFVRR